MAGPFLSFLGAFLCCLIYLEMPFIWMCIIKLSFHLVQEHHLGYAFEGRCIGMSKGQNALLGRMKWPGRMELTTDLKLYENIVFLGKV